MHPRVTRCRVSVCQHIHHRSLPIRYATMVAVMTDSSISASGHQVHIPLYTLAPPYHSLLNLAITLSLSLFNLLLFFLTFYYVVVSFFSNSPESSPDWEVKHPPPPGYGVRSLSSAIGSPQTLPQLPKSFDFEPIVFNFFITAFKLAFYTPFHTS